MTVDITVKTTSSINIINVIKISSTLHVESNVKVNGVGTNVYEGEYEVTPSTNEQLLMTKNKVLSKDVKVKAVGYYEVGNVANGKTIYIGE